MLYPDLSNEQSIQHLIRDLRKLPQVRDWLPATCTAEELISHFPVNKSLPDFINAVFSYYALSKGKRRWGDKTPKNLHAINQILKFFPNAKILIMVRDCRDVVMSLSKADFSKVSYASAAWRWQLDADIIKQHCAQKKDSQVYLLKYENLLDNPGETIKSVLEFFNLWDDPDILKRYAEHDDDVFHTKSSLYMKPLSKKNISKWEKIMSEQEVRECEAIARQGLEYFGYKVVHKDAHISCFKVSFLRIKDFLSLLRNRKNMENYYIYGKLLLKLIVQRVYNRGEQH